MNNALLADAVLPFGLDLAVPRLLGVALVVPVFEHLKDGLAPILADTFARILKWMTMDLQCKGAEVVVETVGSRRELGTHGRGGRAFWSIKLFPGLPRRWARLRELLRWKQAVE
jgi:hypothetical protein